jgi:DNA polymerase-3 subunit alpha
VLLGGMLSAIKLAHSKNPKPGAPTKYAMFDLEDMAGMIRSIVWPRDFVNIGHHVQADRVLAVRGTIDKRPGSEEANFIVDEVIPIADLEARYTRGVRVRVIEETHGVKKLEMLYEILRGYRGEVPFELSLALTDGRKITCRCDNFKIANNPEMRGRVEELLGAENIRLITGRSGGNGRARG